MNRYCTLIVLAFVIILSGCVKKTAGNLIAKAEEAMLTNLDSANMILDKITDPKRLTEEQQYHYNRLRVLHMINYTKDWNIADSLNNVVMDYCLRTNDSVNLQSALFNSGWISLNTNNPDNAIERFINSRKLAEKLDDHIRARNSCYYISRAYSDKNDNENTLFYAKEMLSYLTQDTLLICNNYNYIASQYKRMNEFDSAFYYYNKTLTLFDILYPFVRTTSQELLDNKFYISFQRRGEFYKFTPSPEKFFIFFPNAKIDIFFKLHN